MEDDRSEEECADDGCCGGGSGCMVTKAGSGFATCQLADEEGEAGMGRTAGAEGGRGVAKIGRGAAAVRGRKVVWVGEEDMSMTEGAGV